MPIFTIYWSETIDHSIRVEAEDAEEAMDAVEQADYDYLAGRSNTIETYREPVSLCLDEGDKVDTSASKLIESGVQDVG